LRPVTHSAWAWLNDHKLPMIAAIRKMFMFDSLLVA
jgi:hypothetical protein